MSLFRHAVFETSVAKPSDLPHATGPEIAFAGRSNAGKSSAINTLVGHTRLAPRSSICPVTAMPTRRQTFAANGRPCSSTI
jgi:GTP-binding protein EngB required for normal cell division